MDGIVTIGTSICITLVATSIFSMLLPNSQLDKVIKFAISLFFLTSIISPFASTKLNFHLDMDDIDLDMNRTDLQQEVNSQFSTIAGKNLESSIEKMLIYDGIKVEKVSVMINKTDSNDIYISKILIYINENIDDSTKINRLIEKEVGITPTIIKQRSENK